MKKMNAFILFNIKFILDNYFTFPMMLMLAIGVVITLIISNKIEPIYIPTYILSVVAAISFWYTTRLNKYNNDRINEEKENKHMEFVNKILYKLTMQKGHLMDIYTQYQINKDIPSRHTKIMMTILEEGHYDAALKVDELVNLIEVIDADVIFKAQFSNKKYTYFLGCIRDRNEFIANELVFKINPEIQKYEFGNNLGDQVLLEKLKQYTDKIYDSYEEANSFNKVTYDEVGSEILKKYPHKKSDILCDEVEVYKPKASSVGSKIDINAI